MIISYTKNVYNHMHARRIHNAIISAVEAHVCADSQNRTYRYMLQQQSPEAQHQQSQ